MTAPTLAGFEEINIGPPPVVDPPPKPKGPRKPKVYLHTSKLRVVVAPDLRLEVRLTLDGNVVFRLKGSRKKLSVKASTLWYLCQGQLPLSTG